VEFNFVAIGITAGLAFLIMLFIYFIKKMNPDQVKKVTSGVEEVAKWTQAVVELAKHLVAGAKEEMEDGIITDEEAKKLVKEAIMEFQNNANMDISETTIGLIADGAFFLFKLFVKDSGLSPTDEDTEKPVEQ